MAQVTAKTEDRTLNLQKLVIFVIFSVVDRA